MSNGNMGLFDWGSPDDELLIVKELTKNAQGDSVTKKNLTRPLKGDQTILSYLHEGEQPHFIFHNRSKGLTYNERGQKETVKPSNSNRAFAVFTDQRVLFLVGTDSGTDHRRIKYDDIESVESSSGILKHRIELKTLYANYRFYVRNTIRSEEFKKSVTFLRRQAGLETPEITDTTPNLLPYPETDPIPAEDQQKQRVLQQLRTMDPYDFEHFVADLWEVRGWTTTVSQAAVDQGIDIVATKEDPFPQKQVIQAKRYSNDNTIGSPKIQQYASLRQQEEGADVSVIVTTGQFTQQAENLAQKLNVKLVDAEGLYNLLRETERFDLVLEYSPISVEADVESTDHQTQKTLQSEIDSTEDTSEVAVSPLENAEVEDDSDSDSEEYKKCPSCGEFTDMERTWRKDLIFSVLQCPQCQTMHHESDNELTPLPEYISERDSNTSKYGYYGICASIVLALLSPAASILGFISWILLPVTISRDTRYVRSNSDRNPATGYWVWGAVLVPIIGLGALDIVGFVLALLAIGGAYLIQRSREDALGPNLHQGKMRSHIPKRGKTEK